MKYLVSALIAVLALTACASTPYNPRYRINEIVINNNTREAVREVTIRANDRVFSCGNIAPFGICSNRFAGYVYQSGPVEIEWTLGDNAPRSERLQVGVPATITIGQVLRGIVDIQPRGGIEVQFREQYQFP